MDRHGRETKQSGTTHGSADVARLAVEVYRGREVGGGIHSNGRCLFAAWRLFDLLPAESRGAGHRPCMSTIIQSHFMSYTACCVLFRLIVWL